MTTKSLIPILLLLLGASGCSHVPEIKKFTFRYSMESIGNYKVELQLNPDSTFMIECHNDFFDRFESKRQPLYHEGKLTGEEARAFQRLIARSHLDKMNDSYGFDNPDNEGSIVYMVQLEQDDKIKYVSVNGIVKQQLPRSFIHLVQYSTQFIDKKHHN